MAPYFAALREELRLYGASRLRFDSLYVGGGTPSLCLEELADVVPALHVDHERAIEVLPTHATPAGLARLRRLMLQEHPPQDRPHRRGGGRRRSGSRTLDLTRRSRRGRPAGAPTSGRGRRLDERGI